MIILKKSGIIYDNDINPEHEEYVRKEVESVIPFLGHRIEIEEDFTLEDFFNLIKRDKEKMQIVFDSDLGHYPLDIYIEDIEKECLPEGREELDAIECWWVAEQFDYRKFYEEHKDNPLDWMEEMGGIHEPDENDTNDISIYVDVHGWGEFKPTDDERKNYKSEEDIPTYTSFGLEFTPLNRLKHLPIILNNRFEIKDRNKMHEDDANVVEGERFFTVYDIFGAILSELSFCGHPEDRDERWQEIVDDVDEFEEKMKDEDDDDDDDEQ